MKEPKLGQNANQSYIEFETTEGKCRFGKEDGKLFFEIGDVKTYLTADDGSLDVSAAELGDNATPVVRTNNPIVGANKANVNIDLLDAAIGADIVPGTRTTGQLSMAATILANLKLIDDVIGFDAQMPVSSLDVSRALTIYQNIRALDSKKTVRTIKFRIGNVGVASSDFNFVANADHAEQSIDLGAILPAKCRLVDVMVYTDAAFTNLGVLATDVGLTTGAGDLIGAGNNTAIDAILAAANAGAFISTPSKDAQHVWVNVDPANNWDSADPVGRMTIYISFIDVTNV